MRPASRHRRASRALRYLLAPALALATLAASLPAQAVLTGRVTSAQGAPVQGANVLINEVNVSVGTNADGRYSLTVPAAQVQGQQVMLRVRSVGFTPQSKAIVLATGTQTNDFVLVADAMRLSEVVVTGVATSTPSVRVPFSVAGAPLYGAAAASPPIHVGGAPNTEEYARIADNGFLTAASAPLSTFSIDVDRASYGNVRRFLLQQHVLPPVDAVRVEELVNYFPYDYATPAADAPVAITTEVSRTPWAREHLLVRIGMQSRPVDFATLPPNNLVFLLDVSGSMQDENKLPLVKQSLRLLVQQLRPQDRVAIVVYAGAAGLVLPPTSGAEQGTIVDAIDRLEAGGSTAGGAGIQLAYDVAQRSHLANGNNRIILATDGDFNVGVSSSSELVRYVEARRAEGTYLTVLGFGMGNIKDGRLEQLADKGNGNYAYIDNLLEARKTLVHEAGGTLVTVANDVKLQVEFNPRLVSGYRLIGYENRLLAAEDFADDRKDAGELGAGHAVTALYEVVPVGAETSAELRDAPRLRYQGERAANATAARDELLTVSVRYKRPGEATSRLLRHPVANRVVAPSVDARFASAVAAFGMLLRESPHKGTMTYAAVRALAAGALGGDRNGYRAEFVELVRAAEGLPARVAVGQR